MHNNIQAVCGTSRLVTALALTYRWGSMGFDRFIDFLPDAKHLSAVDKSAFAGGWINFEFEFEIEFEFEFELSRSRIYN